MKNTSFVYGAVSAALLLAITGAGCGSSSAPATNGMQTGTGQESASGQGANQGNAGGGGTMKTGSYTMADVQKHNSGSSCWTAINGNVYDVTNWINQHPGGPDAILSLCGTDGSSAFNGQHGGQGRPESELATFKIGTLTQ
ncbi:MAG TPA: cytochrome b5-like heme/steroid binding domain-containing protein [Verrucomicrobiae bacterium]|nr:cytochrome b5-like heme/steroid binding domain-containing protein [Verrucomicrobiae bacterium]